MILTDDQFERILGIGFQTFAFGGRGTAKRKIEAILNEPTASSDDQVEGYSITQGADRRWYGHEMGPSGLPAGLLPIKRSLDRDEVVAACREHAEEAPERARVAGARREAREARRQAKEREDEDHD